MFKLSQTLAKNWVITLPNPEERGWETQIAEFDMEAAVEGSQAAEAIERSAAFALANLYLRMTGRGYTVTSHIDEDRKRMEVFVSEAIAVLD